MKKRNCGLGLLLGLVVAVTGCGNTAGEIPKLEEPVAANSAYRPVEQGSIGDVEIRFATVVPQTYCCFYDTNVKISDITVEVGDYVEAGSVVAYADIGEARDTLTGLQQELDYENKTYELNSQIAAAKIAQLTDQKQCLQAQTDTSDDETDYDTQIATLQENARYDGLLHQYRVDKLAESIALQQSILADGTLLAAHSGYVTFVKNIAGNADAGASENIVIISDPSDTYLELTDVTVDQYGLSDYEVKYLTIAGVSHEVTEIPYTSEELILAKAADSYPNVRLACPDAGELAVGENYPIYYIKNRVEDVLMIGRDSLYQEGDQYFVYVRTPSNEKERREITIGDKDTHYVEVTSGLTLGEEVYYSSDVRMPADYQEYTVGMSDFELTNYSRTYSLCNAMTYWYGSEYEGSITQIAVEEDQEIKKGDLLYVVDSGEGKAALAQAQNQIDQENLSYETMVKNYDQQLASLTDDYDKQIVIYEKELAEVSHAYRLGQLKKSYRAIAENNDGTGKISVYAREAGTVSQIIVTEGDKVTPGSDILALSVPSGDKLLVQMAPMKTLKNYETNIADVGEQICIQSKDTQATGSCVGWAAGSNNLKKAYLTTRDGKAYLTHSAASGYEYPAFFVRMDDESFYQDMPAGTVSFSYINMKDVTVVPSSLIYREDDQSCFVWRIQNGELVKQYVQIKEDLCQDGMQVVLSGIREGDVLAAE